MSRSRPPSQARESPSTPRLQAFLSGLPQGLDSFPACRAKGSMLRAALELRAIPDGAAALEPRIARLFFDPPPSSAWITEAEYVAFSLAMADLRHMDAPAFTRYWHEVMLHMTDGVYSAALSLLSPSLLLRSMAALWGGFHRGLPLSAATLPGGLLLQMTIPRGLFPPIIFDGFVGVFQALLKRSRRPASRALLEGVLVGPQTTLAKFRLLDFTD